ncbi:hypothetical protein CYMTET_45133 [Cymbomonas tetramitiformis]|uniref:Photosystem II PsbX n=1 Tax=Cymbomonas tetramitiformis TaxID=36881 RepID=A0AAE0EYW4_9CHLO|nr:hypothetical protein CYMTET_45133 [Cymbomonas tetramitiformis]
MAAIASATPIAVKGLSLPARKSTAGRAVAQKKVVTKSVVKTAVVCQKENKAAKAVSAGVSAGVLLMATYPEIAQAAEVTPSLKNLLLSVLAGAGVLGGIGIAVIGVSQFDKIRRS